MLERMRRLRLWFLDLIGFLLLPCERVESTEWLYEALEGTLCQCVVPLWGGWVLFLDWFLGVLSCRGVCGGGQGMLVVVCVLGGVGKSVLLLCCVGGGVGSSPSLGCVISGGVNGGVCVVVFSVGVRGWAVL